MVNAITTFLDRVHIVRIFPGEDILESLEKIVREKGIKSAQISFIGAIERAELGYFDVQRSEYKAFTLEKELEVVSGLGNISRLIDDTVVVHAHLVVADDKGKCYGGHLMKGCEVSVTIEVILMEFSASLHRAKDARTGLNLLDL